MYLILFFVSAYLLPRWAVPAMPYPPSGSCHFPGQSLPDGGGSGSSTVRLYFHKEGVASVWIDFRMPGKATSCSFLFSSASFVRFLFPPDVRTYFVCIYPCPPRITPNVLLLKPVFRCPGRSPRRPSAESSGFQHCSTSPVSAQRRSSPEAITWGPR